MAFFSETSIPGYFFKPDFIIFQQNFPENDTHPVGAVSVKLLLLEVFEYFYTNNANIFISIILSLHEKPVILVARS